MLLKRQRLLAIFGILSTATGNKVMQVADYVQFKIDTENNCLLISSTDFNAFITMNYGDVTAEDIASVPHIFLVNLKLFHSILKASTTEDVHINALKTEGRVVVTTNGTYELTRWSNVDEFPQANYAYKEVAKWPVPVLQSAWNKAVVAVSNDVTKINYQGVNYDGNFAATDNRRLSVALGELPFEGEAVLLLPMFGDILKHCKNEVSIGPNENGNTFVIACDEIGLIASIRIIDAKFVGYRRMLEMKEQHLMLTVDKQLLLGAISRLMLFTDQLYKVVVLRTSKTTDGLLNLTLTINNNNGGSEVVQVTQASFGEGVNPEVVYRYHLDNLFDGISVTEDPKNVVFNVQQDGKMWIEEKNFQYLLTRIED